MPGTAKNQAEYPHPRSQKAGVGLPLARCMAILSLATAAMSGVAFGRMDQLVQLLNGFSTAEILLALMRAQAKTPEHRPRHVSDDAGAAMSYALLAGSRPSQSPAPALSMAEIAAPVTGLVGGQINVQC